MNTRIVLQLWVKLRALCVLDAVHRPCATVVLEVFGRMLMPITSLENWSALAQEFDDKFIEWWNYFITVSHGQSPARAEVVLNIDNNQCLLFVVRHTSQL